MAKHIDDQTKAVLENIEQTAPELLQPVPRPAIDLFAEARKMSDELVKKHFNDIGLRQGSKNASD